MLAMTSPTADALVRRIVLVPLSRPEASPPPALGPRGDRSADTVRRYRLARLRLEGRDVPATERFSHLKRQYD
jgi:hypothetical protein